MKMSNFQTVIFTMALMTMKEYTHKLFKNICNDVQTEDKGEVNTAYLRTLYFIVYQPKG